MKSPYIDRDISWMYFNHRILREAQREDIPLLERLSFLGIYSNNLDEFFRVRMASLNRLYESVDKSAKKQREHLKSTIKTINKLNEAYSAEYTEATAHVFSLLEEHNIKLLNENGLNEEQERFIRDFYYDKLNGATNPVWLDNLTEIGKLQDNHIYLIVKKTEKTEDFGKKPKTDYAVIKVPDEEFGRFITLPPSDGCQHAMYLDDVVRFCLPLIFIGFKPSSFEAYSFKFTKDAEMEMENGADYGMLQLIAKGVNSRKKGEPVRIVYDRLMPKDMQKKIMSRLNVEHLDAALPSGRYQNHKDLMKFPDFGHKELKYPKWEHALKEEFCKQESILKQIREKDRFIHVPYNSFDAYIRVLREAALHPDVKEIKTTLYRLASDSKVVKALACAARNGKKVTAVVELLARFDEKSNIKWSKRMQEEGINVIFGVEGLKVHSKLLYIESKKGNIACIGTGNFHEGNAKVYTDYLMMTARKDIAAEVNKVFDFIDRPFSQPRFRELLVSPNYMKTKLMQLLNNEIKNAKAGKEAWFKMKINHITEPDMVEKLYAASRAGVKVELLVRGNCSLVPGIHGTSDNIKVVGIIDRYLEHSRIIIACNNGQPKYFIGSADWMPRNLTNRIEVYTPVYDIDMQRDLLRTVEYGLADTVNGRLVDGHGNDPIQTAPDGRKFRSQEELQNKTCKQDDKEK